MWATVLLPWAGVMVHVCRTSDLMIQDVIHQGLSRVDNHPYSCMLTWPYILSLIKTPYSCKRSHWTMCMSPCTYTGTYSIQMYMWQRGWLERTIYAAGACSRTILLHTRFMIGHALEPCMYCIIVLGLSYYGSKCCADYTMTPLIHYMSLV